MPDPTSGPRLLFRVDPVPGESPRGYLCRVAHAHACGGPLLLLQIAGLLPCRLQHEDSLSRMSYLLRLEPEEWRTMCYRRIKREGRFDQRLFYGRQVSADDLNYGRPRVCTVCLKERSIWWAVWDLGLVSACPIHRCRLLNQCPACKRRLTWQRPAVYRCRCGLDLRDANAETADPDLIAVNAAIYRAAGFPPGEVAELELARQHFPPRMGELKLGSLLRLILFVGSIVEHGGLRRKQPRFEPTSLQAAIEIGSAAVGLLRGWPTPLRETLRHMLPEKADQPARPNFQEVFGNFYRHLFRVLPRSEFGFLHNAFERFAVEEWQGPIRGQHRYFSTFVRTNSQWIPADEAERQAHITSGRIASLVRQQQIEGMFLHVSRGRGRTECWIRRESLNRWITTRDGELARYMTRAEAVGILGLTITTVLRVAQAGVIESVNGSERCFHTGYHLLREDVLKIKHAFEQHRVPVCQYSKPGKLITLHDALRNYLGRDSGLPAVLRAVVDGVLHPLGYTNRFPGITGYFFLSEDLREYRPVSYIDAPPGGFLNFREAAALLGTRREVVRGLVTDGVLTAPTAHHNGLSRLIPARDVQNFARQYISATDLAKRRSLDVGSLVSLLKHSGAPVFAVPIRGKGQSLFVPKEVGCEHADEDFAQITRSEINIRRASS